MTKPERGLGATDLARLSQMPVEDMKQIVDMRLPQYGNFTVAEFVLNQDSQGEFPMSAALAIEVARQLSDDGGLPILAALEAVNYTGAVAHFGDYDDRHTHPNRRADTDFWVGVLGVRADWGNAPREGWPVTGFGPDECWMKGHYEGTFDQVTAAIKSRMVRDTIDADDRDFPDHARLFMTNVSAAARRLRKRAKDLGIEINID